MKGTAASYGFPEVGVLARRLEEASASESVHDATAAIACLDQLLREARAAS
jgi:HPt (histidine-containing phosphotransfer) domain-containing protein